VIIVTEFIVKHSDTSRKYKPTKEEVVLVGKGVEKELNKIKLGKSKKHTEKEFLNMFPCLKKIKN